MAVEDIHCSFSTSRQRLHGSAQYMPICDEQIGDLVVAQIQCQQGVCHIHCLLLVSQAQKVMSRDANSAPGVVGQASCSGTRESTAQ